MSETILLFLIFAAVTVAVTIVILIQFDIIKWQNGSKPDPPEPDQPEPEPKPKPDPPPKPEPKPKPDAKTFPNAILNLAWSNSGDHQKTPAPAQPFIVMLDSEVSADTVKKYASCPLVIGYISVGTYENNRKDKDEWPDDAIGKALDDWPNEKWLVLDKWKLVKPVMTKRLQALKAKGFTAFEGDNISVIDQFSKPTAAQIATNVEYAKWLASEAHRIGLKCAFKNGPLLVKSVVSDYDLLLTESALAYPDDISHYKAFANAHKPVYGFEYDKSKFSAKADKSVFASIQLDEPGKGWVAVRQ